MTKSRSTWVKLPLWWILYGALPMNEERQAYAVPVSGLRLFSQKNRGNAIASLKLYIALLVRTNNRTSDEDYGRACPSLAELGYATGLSREKLVSAGRFLESNGLLRIERGKGNRNVYSIVGYEKTPWGKLPKRMFTLSYLDGDTLKQISTRSRAGLNALKLYLFLVSSVDRKTGYACRTYYSITEQTGIRRSEIKEAISMLINLKLLVVEHEPTSNQCDPYSSPNRYLIRGVRI